MKLVIDTSAFSAFGRGSEKRLNKWFTYKHDLLVPLIVVGELRAGFAYGNRQQQNERLLQKFLDSPNVSAITLTEKTTKVYAAVFKELKRAGTPINANDMWIAALAVEHQIALLTLDSDFAQVAGLKLVKL